MIVVDVAAHVPHGPGTKVFEVLSDFARYPQHTDVVREVAVTRLDENRITSAWSVNFRTGVLCWTEEDVLDPERMVIEFHQTSGDIARFDGSWSVTEVEGGCDVLFHADFDLGIPTLAALLDPVAERTLRETIESILMGLFGPGTSIARTTSDGGSP